MGTNSKKSHRSSVKANNRKENNKKNEVQKLIIVFQYSTLKQLCKYQCYTSEIICDISYSYKRI